MANLPELHEVIPEPIVISRLVENANTDEEIVWLTTQCVFVNDAADVLLKFAIGDLANKYAPAGEPAEMYIDRVRDLESRSTRLAELASLAGLATETIREHAWVASKFVGRPTTVSWSVFKELAGAEDPEAELTSLLAEFPDATKRQAREYRARKRNLREQAAAAAGLGRGGRSTFQFNDGNLDDEIVAARRRDGQAVVRLAEQELERVEVDEVIPPAPLSTYEWKGYGNWIESDLIDTAEELAGAWAALKPKPSTVARVRRLLAPVMED